jgi:chloride channel protein, CIC family
MDQQDSNQNSLKDKFHKLMREFVSREYSFNLLMGLIIGVIGGYGAIGFRMAISTVQRLTFGTVEPTFHYLLELPWYWRLAIPTIGGLIVGPIVTFFAAEAKGHGVPEVMAAVATRGGIIRGRVAAAKVVASAVTIGTGGSAGSEGPIVQIGSGIASVMGQLLKVSARKMKTFVGCGAAAGIAAVFNAPVAGMLFSLEVILGDFAVKQISPIIVASVTATAVSRMHMGDAPAFAVPDYALISPWELIHYAVLGLAAAVIAVAFAKVLDSSETFFEKLKVPDVIKPAIGGLLIGILGVIGLPHVYGVGYEFIEEALRGELALTLLVGLIFAKIIATSATLGSGGSGGILAPSLFLGAMAGGVVWYGAHALTPDMVSPNYGVYAMVGMAAVVASTTRAPLQAILILFELTGGYAVILPLMLSSIIAVLFGNKMMEESIYTVKLAAKGIVLGRGAQANVLKDITAKAIMRTDYKTVPRNMRLRPLLDVIGDTANNSTLFVINKAGKLHGYISFHELRQVLFDVEALEPILTAGDIANRKPTLITPEDTLDVVIKVLAQRSIDELPVVDPEDPNILIGSVHRRDVIESYQSELTKRDLTGTLESSVRTSNKVQSSPLAPGYSLAEVELPHAYSGKNLKTLDLRNKEGIEVLMIRRRDTDGKLNSTVPDPEFILKHGDILLMSGPRAIIEKLVKS